MVMVYGCRRLAIACTLLSCVTIGWADETPFVPRKQTEPPGPALSPEEALRKMEVPEGFEVELVAAEPDIQNPVAMCFDRRGRIWVTESFEYPRQEPGPGRDRIKILEDADHDGRVDSVKIFAEGLNIPSGIAVGHGGVWVANAPDILFLQDTDGDDRADRQEVVVTGFGRFDTHELPNALTWGPDGALYGLNGVFNPAKIQQDGKTLEFTCAMFRIDPRTRKFELFAEGTSNPWGIAFNPQGEAFISACVIDHLWHLTETGYYHRQGGPYPPYTWKIESIVDHAHQLAAYCGITYFDSAAYPPEYRDRLYMGNIHGGCINVDSLTPRASTYRGVSQPDFLTAHDVWFMPVAQKVGPDGCLYVLDWYDRYHCYQDANADPEGVDRGLGRLYRIRYQGTPRAQPFDLEKESSVELVARLSSANLFYREMAQQVLAERSDSAVRAMLLEKITAERESLKGRMHALNALVGSDYRLTDGEFDGLLDSKEPAIRAWAVRTLGRTALSHPIGARIRERGLSMVHDQDPTVRLQVAIATPRIAGAKAAAILGQVAQAAAEDDPLTARIVWQNLFPLLPEQGESFADYLNTTPDWSPALQSLLARSCERLMDDSTEQAERGLQQLTRVILQRTPEMAPQLLDPVRRRLLSGELDANRAAILMKSIPASTAATAVSMERRVRRDIEALLGDAEAQAAAASELIDPQAPVDRRRELAVVLARVRPDLLVTALGQCLQQSDLPDPLTTALLDAAGRCNEPGVADVVLSHFQQLPAAQRVRAVQLLTQRREWSHALVNAVLNGALQPGDVDNNAVVRMSRHQDAALSDQIGKLWGSVRTEPDPNRRGVLERIRGVVYDRVGNPHQGRAIFQRVCGQCHVLHGEGQAVGPELTRNGRGSFDQLIVSVFDPNVVIGPAYLATTVLTSDGRVLAGILQEDTPQRIVLLQQGGKRDTIAREEIDELQTTKLSLMPEGLENQVNDQELADLFSYLAIETPPDQDPPTLIPGTPQWLIGPRQTSGGSP